MRRVAPIPNAAMLTAGPFVGYRCALGRMPAKRMDAGSGLNPTYG